MQNLLAQVPFLIIGHRGAAGLAPENTLPSFARAKALGCPMVELDVYRLPDRKAHPAGPDVLAVIHDRTLDRTTNRRGPVADLRAEDLQRTDAGEGASIPTLDEVIKLLQAPSPDDLPHATALNIELKGPGTAAPVAQRLERLEDMVVLVSSFNHDELAQFRALDSTTPVAPLFDRWQDNWIETATALNASAVNLSVRAATQAHVAEIRAAGYACFVYTVNRPEKARRLWQSGVNGVFSDRPDLLLPLLPALETRG
ncbi:MAG: glycerophosphodiester phosphodiesterase family protein [Pseudomonadota bacterium]